jgi:hypothetical protein
MYSEPPGFADEGYQSKVSIYTIVLPRAVFDLVPPPKGVLEQPGG